MLESAGGENIFADVKQQSVQATAELILARRPEVIRSQRN
jgi:ABC-type Fe3+-hydroxamate transport system substrate-binding protein